MAINNYINLQKNDFSSPYLDGFANLKKSMSPQSTSQIYNSNRTITLIPFSVVDRVCHFVTGIGLMIPVINLVISCALRYFATQTVPASSSNQVIPQRPSSAEAQVAPINTDSDEEGVSTSSGHEAVAVIASSAGDRSADGIVIPATLPQVRSLSLEAQVAAINTGSGERALPDAASSSTSVVGSMQHGRCLSEQATPQDVSSAAPQSVRLSPDVLVLVASRRAQGALSGSAILPQIPEDALEEDGSSPETASLPRTAETFSLGAGVAPYRFHLGEIEILIGRNRNGGGSWSYFGGESDVEELPMHTAARRCEEVTGGFLGRRDGILAQLNEADKIGHNYKTYFMPVSDLTITAERFLQPRPPVAKTQIAWVKFGELLSVARNPTARLKIEGRQEVLHPSFRATLIDPSSQDVLRRIGSIRSTQSLGVLRSVSSVGSERFRRVA